MKIDITELKDGSNPARFEIPADTLRGIVRDVDELFDARGPSLVDFDIQKVDALMIVRGSVSAPISFECARCLATRERAVYIPIQWSLLPKHGLGGNLTAEEEIELTSDDLDTSFYEGEEIDLGELAREALLLELDPAPRCADDEDCRVHPAVIIEPPPSIDARWAPLAAALHARKSAH